MTVALQIDGLSKRFGEQQVLNGFSLQVARGDVVGLLGPNGCGKSTVLNIICLLLQADADPDVRLYFPATTLYLEDKVDFTATVRYFTFAGNTVLTKCHLVSFIKKGAYPLFLFLLI